MSDTIYRPSKSAMWIACHGAMTFPENQVAKDAGPYAAEGNAMHVLASRTLLSEDPLRLCSFYLGETIQIGERVFTVDDDRAMAVQVYVDYVRDLAAGGHLFVEQEVDLSGHFGIPATGTLDAGVAKARNLDIIDLKGGRGVPVYAAEYSIEKPPDVFSFWTPDPAQYVTPNSQLMCYGLGAIDLLDMFGPFDTVTLHIVQPRRDHISSVVVPVAAFAAFAELAREAIADSLGPNPGLTPGEHQCRWCEVRHDCPALAAMVEDETGYVGTVATADEFIPASTDNAGLALKFAAVPLIRSWCKAVEDELRNRVMAGVQIIGVDGLPFKIVQGKPGNMDWTDISKATSILTGQLADKAYAPLELITPSAAKKKLGKKREKIWDDILKPLTDRADGKAQLALGSDPKEAFTTAATAAEFETGDSDGDE